VEIAATFCLLLFRKKSGTDEIIFLYTGYGGVNRSAPGKGVFEIRAKGNAVASLLPHEAVIGILPLTIFVLYDPSASQKVLFRKLIGKPPHGCEVLFPPAVVRIEEGDPGSPRFANPKVAGGIAARSGGAALQHANPSVFKPGNDLQAAVGGGIIDDKDLEILAALSIDGRQSPGYVRLLVVNGHHHGEKRNRRSQLDSPRYD